MDSIISLGLKNILAEYMILFGADNYPPMLDKDLYDSWKSRMELYMQNREHGRMILELVEHGPLIWPTIEENGVIRTKKYTELSAAEKIQANCDMKATNIILQGLPTDIYSLVNHHRVAKDEVKYGEFGRPAPFNESSGAKFHVRPPGYYSRIDNETPFGEKIPNLVEMINTKMVRKLALSLKTYYFDHGRPPDIITLDTVHLKEMRHIQGLLGRLWTRDTYKAYWAVCGAWPEMSATKVYLYSSQPQNTLIVHMRFKKFIASLSLHHLLKARGVVGRALSSRGSCFCGDVTKLGEEEYSLGPMARAADFTSCFAIFLHSIEHDAEFVLEFFLPIAMKEDADLQNFVQDLKLHFTFSSGFELGDLLNTTSIELSTEVSKLSLAIQPDIIHTSLTAELVELELLTERETSSQIECTNAQEERDSGNDYYNFVACPILGNTISVEEGCGSVEKKISLKPQRKRKLQSFTLETLQQYFKMPIGEASRSLDGEWTFHHLAAPTW
nr:NIN-like protein [Tanacetum cinerariifolium]